MKAKMVSFKYADGSMDLEKLFEAETILMRNNITIGDTGMFVGSGTRDIQLMENEIDKAIKILKENGYEIVKIEDDIMEM